MYIYYIYMKNLQYKIKYMKYKSKYLQLKEKKQSGGSTEIQEINDEQFNESDKSEELDASDEFEGIIEAKSPKEPSAFKVQRFKKVNFKNFEDIISCILDKTSHRDHGLNIARFLSDISHDMSSRKDKIKLGTQNNETSLTLLNKFLDKNTILKEHLLRSGYDINKKIILNVINHYHSDSRIGILEGPKSKFSIQSFMNLDLPDGYYLSMDTNTTIYDRDQKKIAIIDKGSEHGLVNPGRVWANGNEWFLDGLKPIPKNLATFKDELINGSVTLETTLDNIKLHNLLFEITSQYFNDKLLKYFYVNDIYTEIEYNGLELIDKGSEYQWYVNFRMKDKTYRVNITNRGSSTYTYDLVSLEIEDSNNIVIERFWENTDLGSLKKDFLELCNLVCLTAKAFGDASYKIFISTISLYYLTTEEGHVHKEKGEKDIICAIASQDRQLVRDLMKTFLVIKNKYLEMKVFFKTNMNARLVLLANSSGYINNNNFFENMEQNFNRNNYVIMSIKRYNEDSIDINDKNNLFFILYEVLRIILLTTYGELRKSACILLDNINSLIRFPQRPIIRNFLKDLKNLNKRIITDIIKNVINYLISPERYVDSYVVILTEDTEKTYKIIQEDDTEIIINKKKKFTKDQKNKTWQLLGGPRFWGDIIESHFDPSVLGNIFYKYKDWIITVSGEKELNGDDFSIKLFSLFEESIEPESTISIINLLSGSWLNFLEI